MTNKSLLIRSQKHKIKNEEQKCKQKKLNTKTRILLLPLSLKMIDTIKKAITLGISLIIGRVELNPGPDQNTNLKHQLQIITQNTRGLTSDNRINGVNKNRQSIADCHRIFQDNPSTIIGV
jgi:hypothetical protein